jgi:hypothetical protein
VRPLTARELWNALVELFPGFGDDGASEELEMREREGTPALHFVMMEFTSYFGGNTEAFSEQQLKAFGSLVNEAVLVDDDLENAISTCFLEHLHQVRSYKVLAPHLSVRAKGKTHA